MSHPEPVVLAADSAEATRDIGRALAALLRPGDVVILSGDLGAGKTTLTQGLAAGLGVSGAVTSPTFVISRVHPAGTGAVGLVHVDAYRLGGGVELDDLDIDAFTDQAVTVVEWGEGMAEVLSPNRLHVHLARSSEPSAEAGGPLTSPASGAIAGRPRLDMADDSRVVTVTPTGNRWIGVPLVAALVVDDKPPLRTSAR